MHERLEERLRSLARRAGWASAPPQVVAAGLMLAGIAIAFAAWRWWPSGGTTDEGASRQVGELRDASATAGGTASRTRRAPSASEGEGSPVGGSAGSTVCVDVVGAVHHPGVYVLGSGVRVASALDAAGGPVPGAATDAINLAAKVEDGQQIVVPTREQVAEGAAPVAAASGGAGAVTSPAAKVDVNTADATQLDALPGIGPSTAAKIVADRQANGRFKSVDDLGRVPGIGPKKLDTLRDLIVVR